MGRILLVVADPANIGTDSSGNALYTHWQAAGHTVTLQDKDSPAPAGLNTDYDVAVLGNSCDIAMTMTAYDAATIPVMATGIRSPHSGYAQVAATNGPTQTTQYVKAAGIGDPITPADIVTEGTVTMLDVAFNTRYVLNTQLGAGHHQIACVSSGNLPQLTITRYDTGDAMWSGSAPSKRAWVMIHAGSISTGGRGWEFLDNALNWMLPSVMPLGINAGSDQAIFTGQVASLSAAASGGAGTKSYAWITVSGPAGTFGSADAASTTFTPSAAGVCNLRCTVTDSTGSAYDDVQITVTEVTSSASVASVVDSTNWTVEPSGTALAALTDSDGSTLLRSSSNPTAQALKVQLTPINAPGAGVDLVVQVTCDAITAGSASLTAQLYEGATLRSTVSGLTVSAGDNANPVTNVVSVSFPAADVASVTDWTTGLIVNLAFTAAV